MLNSRPVDNLGGPRVQIGPTPFSLNRIPATSDINYPIGQMVVYEAGNTFYGLAKKSAGVATWVHMGSTLGGPVYTLTGGSGGALSPSSGNLNILGTASQITSAGSGSTITLSIPAAFIAPGSIASTTTVTAGTGLTATTGNIVATAGAVNAGTSMTATLGNITATNGNLVLNTAGNKIVSTSVGASSAAGANSFGTVTLVGGTVTVSTTAVTANSIVVLTRMSVGATGANDLGILSVGTIVAGTSFVINAWTVTNATALQADDVSVIGWMIIN